MVEPLNAVRLVAVLQQRGMVRYTPAGLPMLDATLHHQSRQQQSVASRPQGGPPVAPRSVDFELATIFPGELAERANALPVGAWLDVRGYLASRRMASRSLVLHVTDFAQIDDPRATEPGIAN